MGLFKRLIPALFFLVLLSIPAWAITVSSIWDWSSTAANNNCAPPNCLPENSNPSTVDDTVRQMDAFAAEFVHSTVAAGTADALTVTLVNIPNSLTDGMEIHVRAAASNATTTPTLNLNSLGAKTITKLGGTALAVGDIAGNLHEMILRYNLANTRWELLNPVLPIFSQLTNSLSGDVNLNNVGSFFDGPVVSQGTTGTWFATGTVTLTDTGGTANFQVKLWDGTTVIASAASANVSGSNIAVSLSGYIANPAGNIRISVIDVTHTTGLIKSAATVANASTISVFRIQ